ncbi:hypothetical protein DVT68_18790 [Dyella solisilvae]|uniref:Spore coat protein U domain-containing protein n=1 Tax=Dyella solisilvae TaxID=1920168 RepID=A0A370K389_9GAMM|nr:hypothetical protein [Dyella solisilvae]RDI97124.1 hypothetical protein DVT68_18790 [Dyella solisilvae]
MAPTLLAMPALEIRLVEIAVTRALKMLAMLLALMVSASASASPPGTLHSTFLVSLTIVPSCNVSSSVSEGSPRVDVHCNDQGGYAIRGKTSLPGSQGRESRTVKSSDPAEPALVTIEF